jgi:oxygen-independent coproporphyrinogen III oxidase
VVAGRLDLVERYLAAIERELSCLETPRPVGTLYFGGGTPTQLSPADFTRLAECVLRWHPLLPGAEWTVEANPADIDADYLRLLAQLGVTRLSLGSQSFSPHKLELLERDHAPEQIAWVVSEAQGLGLAVSLDLIFATPGETLADWQKDLEAALTLQPQHTSTYELTYERGTAFWSRQSKGMLPAADEELQRAMYELAIDTLTAAGFEHYEVSNFALPGCRSRHNETYWMGSEYFAAGPGAARYVNGVRETNHRSTTTYLKRVLASESPVAERDKLSPEGRARECLVFGLRRLDGVPRQEFRERTGFSLDELAGTKLGELLALGMLTDDGECVKLTRDGLMIADAIGPMLL